MCMCMEDKLVLSRAIQSLKCHKLTYPDKGVRNILVNIQAGSRQHDTLVSLRPFLLQEDLHSPAQHKPRDLQPQTLGGGREIWRGRKEKDTCEAVHHQSTVQL